ncbi:MAG: hypothetical protein H0W70_13270 [Actinobacteria bacterium]|nr:hypothetical protein [Actinomycetota bacterium]
MDRQLTLIRVDTIRGRDDDWRLDEHTKELGKQGLSQARQALAAARRRSAA